MQNYLDLAFHGETEKGYEIHNKNRPKHGDVEDFEEGTYKGNDGWFGDWVPKLELW